MSVQHGTGAMVCTRPQDSLGLALHCNSYDVPEQRPKHAKPEREKYGTGQMSRSPTLPARDGYDVLESRSKQGRCDAKQKHSRRSILKRSQIRSDFRCEYLEYQKNTLLLAYILGSMIRVQYEYRITMTLLVLTTSVHRKM